MAMHHAMIAMFHDVTENSNKTISAFVGYHQQIFTLLFYLHHVSEIKPARAKTQSLFYAGDCFGRKALAMNCVNLQ
jgi:hypothetical protein